MKISGTILFIFALCFTYSVALADVQVLGKAKTTLEFFQLPKANKLIGGEIATANTYPGVFRTRQGNSSCTGTVIGKRVVASAAHCMSNGGRLTLNYDGATYSGRCTHAREYRNNATADWALCLLNTPIPDDIAESVNTNSDLVQRGTDVILMGYGCTRPGGNGGNDGNLRVGSAPIIQTPSGTNYDIVTRGQSALCYGDSGGPAFLVDEDGVRWQASINSRGNIRTTSYLSSLHIQTAQNFYRSWSEDKGVKICGIHEDAEGCLANAK